jgi:hypothetical protein
MVCLSGQDDTCYIINFEERATWLKVVGHNSFISRAVFSKANDRVRVIIGSYDGYLSFSEINKEVFEKFRKEDEALNANDLNLNGLNANNRVMHV